jgi:hypothetical protein
MSEQPTTSDPLDSFDTWKTMRDANRKIWKMMRDANLEIWSKVMIDMISSEDYSQATSQWLNAYLALPQPFRRIMETTTTQVLTRLNMPTQNGVTSLAERMTNVEMRLDDLDSKLDDIHRAIKALSISNHTVDTKEVH